MSHKFADSSQQTVCVKWKTPDDGQRNSPKHVDFYSKNKFEKLLHLGGFIIKILNAGMIKVDESWKLILAIHLGLCQMSIFN